MSDDPFYAALAEALSDECDWSGGPLSPEGTAADIPGWDSLAHARIMLNLEARLGRAVNMRDTYAAADFGALRDLFMA